MPKTVCYTKEDEIPLNITYPCIIKPLKSISGSKNDIQICIDKNHLNNAIKETKTSELLIQQYIKKDFDILLIGCRLLSNGDVILPGIFKKYRWAANGDGSWGIITNKITDFFDKETIVRFLNNLNYYGPFSIEFGVSDNIPYFFEINLRIDGTTYYFNKLNTNVAYIWALDCNKQIISEDSNQIIEYRFIDELEDIGNIFTGKISFFRWIKDLSSAKAYKYFDKTDLVPFLKMAPRRIASAIFKSINHKH